MSICKRLLLAWLAFYPCWQSHAFVSNQYEYTGIRPFSSHRIRSSSSSTPSITSSSTDKNKSHGIDKATVTLIDPETNVQVVLLGCFHGSQSSARDVKDLLQFTDDNNDHDPTKAVVLELCASRFSDMRKHMEDEQQEEYQQRPWILRFASMVSKITQTRGIPSGIASAVLGLVSGWQTAFAGLEPGLEFRTAVLYNPVGSDIILADQSVDETLNKIGDLPLQSANLFRHALKNGWKESFGIEADALGTAIFGSDQQTIKDYQLSVPVFMTRSPGAIKDLLRLSMPPLVGLNAFNWLVSSSASSTSSHVVAASMDHPVTMMTTEHIQILLPVMMLAVLGSNVAVLLLLYLFVALPAGRVVLRERDDRLAEGIRAACRIVAQEKKDQQAGANTDIGTGRVVAVLGLLHVNGVAKRLLDSVDCLEDSDLQTQR